MGGENQKTRALRNTITRPVARNVLQDPTGLNMELCHFAGTFLEPQNPSERSMEK